MSIHVKKKKRRGNQAKRSPICYVFFVFNAVKIKINKYVLETQLILYQLTCCVFIQVWNCNYSFTGSQLEIVMFWPPYFRWCGLVLTFITFYVLFILCAVLLDIEIACFYCIFTIYYRLEDRGEGYMVAIVANWCYFQNLNVLMLAKPTNHHTHTPYQIFLSKLNRKKLWLNCLKNYIQFARYIYNYTQNVHYMIHWMVQIMLFLFILKKKKIMTKN